MPNPPWRLLLILLVTGLLQACDGTVLYSQLSEREANNMVAVLLRSGIAAQRSVREDGQMSVSVPQARLADAMGVLEKAGLPEQRFSNIGEVFKSGGLVSSPVQERAQMIYALGEELSNTVSKIDGVVAARVHVVLPDNDLLKRVISPSSASVLVRYEPGADMDRLIPQIKTLVANSVAGLTYEGVSVTPIEATARTLPSEQAPPMTSLFGIWILDASLDRARLLLGVGVLLVAGLGGALGWQLWRRRGTAGVYRLTEPN